MYFYLRREFLEKSIYLKLKPISLILTLINFSFMNNLTILDLTRFFSLNGIIETGKVLKNMRCFTLRKRKTRIKTITRRYVENYPSNKVLQLFSPYYLTRCKPHWPGRGINGATKTRALQDLCSFIPFAPPLLT